MADDATGVRAMAQRLQRLDAGGELTAESAIEIVRMRELTEEEEDRENW